MTGIPANSTLNTAVLTTTTPNTEHQPLPTPTEFNVVQIYINKTKAESEDTIVNPIKNQIQTFINANIPTHSA